MIDALSSSRNRRVALILLAVCGAFALGAAAVSVSDNPPGIALAYLAAMALVLAFVHPWRTVRKFLFLLVGSVLGFVLFAVPHNLLAAAADLSAGGGRASGPGAGCCGGGFPGGPPALPRGFSGGRGRGAGRVA